MFVTNVSDFFVGMAKRSVEDNEPFEGKQISKLMNAIRANSNVITTT